MLQDILSDISFYSLPPAWTTFDLASFSRRMQLWDYQKEALTFALRALWKYYEDFADYDPTEAPLTTAERKHKLFAWYRNNGLDQDLSIPLDSQRSDLRVLLDAFYPADNGRISYEHFINRISFWMATGSGKTLVLVKLLELLWRLIRRGEVPPSDIMVLTCRDDLLAQLREHVKVFNEASADLHIHLRDLRDYPEVKRGGVSLFHERELTVFIYRSDNLSDEQKERIIDFRNYDNNGRWYILLDEAHKGDKEDSKRQHIYSILSRNGFLFNFSATFTDDRDIITTAYNFNLARFIESGYGKHVTVLRQENRAFRDKEDYTGEEKQRAVLKALIMLAYIRHAQADLESRTGRADLYHRPLLVALVNSVNTEDADLKLFFRELERIGRGNVSAGVWRQASDELWRELNQGPELLFEGSSFRADKASFDLITPELVQALVFNASAPGATEVWVRPSNRQEIAFKLKSADQPYALIKIGDITPWIKEELDGYEVIEGFEDAGFFDQLNRDDSSINLLLGSRSFYEGWDSNRPNVITFINIGVGTSAQKFILQSVGRGVRIEPLPGKRRRLQHLCNAGDAPTELCSGIANATQPIETLFIFGTNRNAVHTVIEEMHREAQKESFQDLPLSVNDEAVDAHLLLVPVYRSLDRSLMESQHIRKFEVATDELQLLQQYVDYLGDDRLLLARHGASPKEIHLLRGCIADPGRYFNTGNGRRYGSVDLMLDRLFDYFHIVPQEFDHLKPLEDEIRHFRQIQVSVEHLDALRERIDRVRDVPRRLGELKEKYDAHQMAFEEFLRQAKSLRDAEEFRLQSHILQIKHIANHYYTPVLLGDTEKIDFIRHIIRHPSEVRFIRELEKYLESSDNAFTSFDWWLFSKIDEALDDVYIPYYDPDANRIRRFFPDFVFWLQRGKHYFIFFADPKGIQQTNYQYKIDGFRQLFEREDGRPRVFSHDGLNVQVRLGLFTHDANLAPKEYANYWFDSPASLIGDLVGG